jgi:formate dehydrogenase subunit gamma
MVEGERMKDEPRILRFVLAERLSHWLYAAFFLMAFISGLLMWIPATRAWMAGARRLVAHYHGGAGLLMVVIPAVLFLILDRKRLAADVHDIDLWDADDRRWFWAALRGRTLRGREMPPQGRFNAGQKANAILVAAMALGFVVTGSMLQGREYLPLWLVSRALWLHDFLTIAGIALLLGHLTHVFLTRHGRDSLRAMVGGTLSQQTARDRYVKWWRDM